jgi:diacylglycerol kinase family enzyme
LSPSPVESDRALERWDAAAPIHVLLNPAGARGRAGRRWARLEPLFQSRFPELTIHRSSEPGSLTARAREIAGRSGPALVLAAGGDGTSHEVINGLAGAAGWINPEVRLGWIPLGSGNDLALALGFGSPVDPGAFADLVPGRIDLGLVESGAGGGGAAIAFGNSVTFGITADVLRAVGSHGKALGGRLGYGLAAMGALLRHRPGELALTLDGRTVRGPTWLASITNGPRLGAGMRIAPAARFDDGRFDVVRVADCSRLRVGLLFPRVYWGGHLGGRGIEATTAGAISIEGTGPIDFEADGELHRAELPLVVRMVAGGLPIVRPRAAASGVPAD